MFECLEPVEIFDHMLSFSMLQRQNITTWELLRIIPNSFIYSFCIHPIQVCDVFIKEHMLPPNEN